MQQLVVKFKLRSWPVGVAHGEAAWMRVHLGLCVWHLYDNRCGNLLKCWALTSEEASAEAKALALPLPDAVAPACACCFSWRASAQNGPHAQARRLNCAERVKDEKKIKRLHCSLAAFHLSRSQLNRLLVLTNAACKGQQGQQGQGATRRSHFLRKRSRVRAHCCSTLTTWCELAEVVQQQIGWFSL